MLQDLRHGLRLVARSPGFAFSAIAVLAIGIGLNTAVFSLTYAVAFSPRPFAEPERIVQLYNHDRKAATNYRAFSYPLYRDVAKRSDLFDSVFAHKTTLVGVTEAGATRRALVSLVSANFFQTLGVSLARGRGFTPAEERPGANVDVLIASYQYWRKRDFAPDVVGSTVRINERPFTIVGIAPEGFSGTMMLVGPEFYFPLGVFSTLASNVENVDQRTLERADAYNLLVVARLASGVTHEVAAAALGALGRAVEEQFPVEFKDRTIGLGPLPRLSSSTSPRNEQVLGLVGLLMLSLSGSVLLIVCLNLAGLLLARGHARRKEFAIRLALGGGRARLIRQLCVEGSVLAVGGGALGLAIASTANSWLAAAINQRLPITLFFTGGLSPVVVAATTAFCLLATLAFALGPALKLSRTDVFIALKGIGDEGDRPRHRWLPRHPLVVAQIALSLALLVAASLFVRMALNLGNTETGMAADHTVLVEVDAGLGGFEEAQGRQIFTAVRDRLAALPGVESASAAGVVPFGMVHMGYAVRRAGTAPAAGARPASPEEGQAFDGRWNSVTADYFSSMGLPILRGRAFTEAEVTRPGEAEVVILDEVLARELWPEGDALGQRIQWAGQSPGGVKPDSAAARTMEIVGIVRATRDDFGQKEPGRNIYVPFGQGYRPDSFFHLRPVANTKEGAVALLDVVRRTVRETAPGLPVFRVETFARHMETNVDAWLSRLGSTLFAFFGGVSMLVAVVGIYGVKAYSVSRRTREIGVRMALGARAGDVQAMILREGATIACSGIALGLLLSLGVGRAMAALFVDVPAFDGAIFGTATLAFALAALAACWVPARRATRVNPLEALRSE